MSDFCSDESPIIGKNGQSVNVQQVYSLKSEKCVTSVTAGVLKKEKSDVVTNDDNPSDALQFSNL